MEMKLKKYSKIKLWDGGVILKTQQREENGRQRKKIKNDGTVDATKSVDDMIRLDNNNMSIYTK